MKVLHVSFGDLYGGGASRAAYRIHRGLLDIGVDSRMRVSVKRIGDYTVIGPETKLGKLLAKFRPRVGALLLKLQKTSNLALHSVNILPTGLHRIINKMNVDVVNLHWINAEMISITEIAKIDIPIVWTLHDMWPFCGAEHYGDLNSNIRYKEGYSPKNRLKEHGSFDIDRSVWKRKMKHWKHKRFRIVTPSQWLADCARESLLLRHQKIEVIPNGLDLQKYKPMEKHMARKLLTLPQDKKLILFGSIAATKDRRKGFQFLQPALKKLASEGWKNRAELIVFGAEQPQHPLSMDIKAHYLGRLYDDLSLAVLYAAADVFVLPSMQDNLPNTIAESLACGTPCVAFNIGGIPDMIESEKNGYLAHAYDIEDIAKGIAWILEDQHRWRSLSENARRKAEKEFDILCVAKRYAAVYRSMIL